ncbi:MAG TPA: CDP-alcohol phosphatidyltransferase family protein [Thioalkalivibrio sp.]|nr:CDP-alcohol phosphatidyltransferase family protein [Thioalkalivibrio sp.]
MSLSMRKGEWTASLNSVLAQALAWRVELVLGVLLLLAGAWLMSRVGAFPLSGIGYSLLAFVALALLVLYTSPSVFLVSGPGLANRVTFLRASLVLPLAVASVAPMPLETSGALGLIGLGIVALALDAVDGAVARRHGCATPFGARFDMELDAFLILVLALLVWRTGQAGAWVLLIGLMRYGFVAAAWVWRWLDAALPPSRRRQALCVVQSAVLLVALAPFVSLTMATVLALAALLLLIYSFTVDVLWLYRHRPATGGEK